MNNLTEEMKSNLIKFQNLNADMVILINKIDSQFRPLVNKAYQEKDVMELVSIRQTLPVCDLQVEVALKISDLLKPKD